MAEAKTNAGSKLYICITPKNSDLTETEFKALAYVQVKKVGSVGERGINTNIVTYDTWDTVVALKGKPCRLLRCSAGGGHVVGPTAVDPVSPVAEHRGPALLVLPLDVQRVIEARLERCRVLIVLSLPDDSSLRGQGQPITVVCLVQLLLLPQELALDVQLPLQHLGSVTSPTDPHQVDVRLLLPLLPRRWPAGDARPLVPLWLWPG